MSSVSPNFLLLTRVGFAARGLLYLIIGYLALQLGEAKDAGGALEHVSREAGGVVLGALALGFVAYGVWRLADVVFDTQNKGKDAKGVAGRAAGAVSGLIHLGLAFTAIKLALGSGSAGDSSNSAESGAATAMGLPGGDLLLYLAAGILAAAGIAQLVIAAKRGFCKHLAPEARDKWWVIAAGTGGHAARGVIFLAAAWLLFNAARHQQAEEAGALADALTSLPDSLRAAVAAGLCLFGIYSLIEALPDHPQPPDEDPGGGRLHVSREGIFPTFFLSGFECSTFVWKDQGRRDLCAETQHLSHSDEDYRMLRSLGIAVAREGIPWPLVDKGGGSYDFSFIDPFLQAQRRYSILPIWDLCHYGYPDDADPFRDDFAPRFAAYAAAAARYVAERAHHGPLCFTPMNEPTFFGYMAGEWAWAAPFGKDRETRLRLTLAMAAADIAAVKAIRADFPDARMVHIDPLIWVVPPRDRPDLAEAAHRESHDDAYLAWDAISGRRFPELGGSPEILDIIGFNNYSFGQMEYREKGPHAALEPGDDRIRPLCDLIEEGAKPYGRPCIVAETSGLKGGRPDWLNDVVSESLAAVNRGVDLHGVCLFPAVDMPDWGTGEWVKNGIADVERLPSGALMRVPYVPYVEALHSWQRRLNRVTELDEDPFDQAVNLEDIRRAAVEMKPAADVDWS